MYIYEANSYISVPLSPQPVSTHKEFARMPSQHFPPNILLKSAKKKKKESGC